ncbi:L-xylulose/3-keto-L-gulonate kinase [Serratia quinivorans]|uniref:FGGY-family carbohydrate kinase n=1 Tax=Serratia quinivorans TaxID=137545 RepID=UPI00217C1CEE|nr:FGGY-family carbohydrate kinase [Serratia quinivorans]CAI0709301.1 L-xylulose/3-keto-L-gulonate kinase [Serratia quinivorans]CAI0952781.1 L-xylulose/3-keto-L-gulonate kinase [Serratia quinivorans]CAI1199897.1 L-xylulose/3-keto-L-gulonate kinase [Serratia quinivorans]CAI1876544.1 L-xylulose/3-keto-L-gulonate kinase [Serratia quinivorans]CAI1953573.1 L-xylulose/3-keto-L-gulonate kinase [Serratia quinivorans]
MDYWLGLDCGGTFIKAGLYNRQGTELGIARRNLEIISPQPGWAQRDMPALWHTAAEVIRELLARTNIAAGDIQAVGISAQGKGAFLLDQQGQPLGNAMLSSDQRALTLVQEWQKQGVPQALYPQTRQTLWTGHPVSLLRWVRQHQPERYRQIGSVLMAHDFLRYCLTGELACEETNISESNLYQMAEGRYDPALAQLLGIGDIMPALPPIVGSAEIAGRVNAAAAKATGLLAGTPVVGGLFDVVSTALCAGLHDETRLNAVMGTWSVTSGITDKITEGFDHPFVYGRHAEAGKYIVHEASPTSAANLEWFCRQWGLQHYAQLNDWVATLPKAASSLLFVPFLYGSNAGLGLSASFHGMQAFHQREHLVQAIYEGVVFCHMTHLNRMRQRFPAATALRVTGGPAKSAPWMQMFADVSGLPVELPQVEETGCLGAAMAAMVGSGAFSDFTAAQRALAPRIERVLPDAAAAEAYGKKYQRYQALVATLQTLNQPGKEAL